MLFRHTKTETPKGQLSLHMEVEPDNGWVTLSGEVPEPLQSDVNFALQYLSRSQASLEEGRLSVTLRCLRRHSPEQKIMIIREFCDRFKDRCGVKLVTC
jgi:hypothetical protein